MAKKDIIETTKAITEELLSALGTEAKTKVSQDKENEALVIQIETDDPGILIGRHGETLNALQIILGQIFYRRVGEWRRVMVNVGDWRERREETVRALARSIADQVRETRQPQPLYDLTAAERRLVHLELAEDPQVASESEGEGRERHMVIKIKEK